MAAKTTPPIHSPAHGGFRGRFSSAMHRILVPIAIFLVACTAVAEQGQSAFKAYASLPHDAALRLAKIAGCEGSPQPARWHFVIHEAEAENGLRDYVIADGRIVAENAASQFADEVRVEDVLALNSVQIDSDYVARIAAQYAAANAVKIASMNYELHKNPMGRPVWKVTCLDPRNRILGWVVVDAADGKVAGQGGFEFTPAAYDSATGEPTVPDLVASEPPDAALPAPGPTVAEQDTDAHTSGSRPPPASAQPGKDGRPLTNRPRELEVRRAEPVDPPPQHRGFLSDLFRPGRKLFPF
jgi:hypothetical protein